MTAPEIPAGYEAEAALLTELGAAARTLGEQAFANVKEEARRQREDRCYYCDAPRGNTAPCIIWPDPEEREHVYLADGETPPEVYDPYLDEDNLTFDGQLKPWCKEPS